MRPKKQPPLPRNRRRRQPRQGVRWHDGWGEFTAKDVVHSMAYYTNPDYRAPYSDYFRSDPGGDVEIVNDYEVNIHMKRRPAVDFIYWYSGYRGIPHSSKAQWDQSCPGGETDCGNNEAGLPLNYSYKAGTQSLKNRNAPVHMST